MSNAIKNFHFVFLSPSVRSSTSIKSSLFYHHCDRHYHNGDKKVQCHSTPPLAQTQALLHCIMSLKGPSTMTLLTFELLATSKSGFFAYLPAFQSNFDYDAGGCGGSNKLGGD